MKLKIMAVDDDPGVLGVIKAMVESVGSEVSAFSDSLEAARRVKSQSFDAIFLDATMPGIDGFELTAQIRASSLNGKVPVVMVTGYDDIQTMRQGFKAGVTYFIGKPVSYERVQGLYNAVLGPMLTQRRRHARLPFITPVSCTVGEKNAPPFSAKSVNIGEGGMSIEGACSLQVGNEVVVQFSLPQAPKPLRIAARVVRVAPPNRFAVEFLQPPAYDLEAIQIFIVGEVQK